MIAQRKAAGLGSEAASQTTDSHHGSPTDVFLSRLDRVKRTSPSSWTARCPAHEDKGPSLSIREAGDSKVLLHCFAGCSVHEVVKAVGLQLEDLFPPRQNDPAYVGKPERRPFPAADAFRAVAFECQIIALAALHIAGGGTLSGEDRERILTANGRIQSALDAGGLSHG